MWLGGMHKRAQKIIFFKKKPIYKVVLAACNFLYPDLQAFLQFPENNY